MDEGLYDLSEPVDSREPSGSEMIDGYQDMPEAMPEMPSDVTFELGGITEPPEPAELDVIGGFGSEMVDIPDRIDLPPSTLPLDPPEGYPEAATDVSDLVPDLVDGEDIKPPVLEDGDYDVLQEMDGINSPPEVTDLPVMPEEPAVVETPSPRFPLDGITEPPEPEELDVITGFGSDIVDIPDRIEPGPFPMDPPEGYPEVGADVPNVQSDIAEAEDITPPVLEDGGLDIFEEVDSLNPPPEATDLPVYDPGEEREPLLVPADYRDPAQQMQDLDERKFPLDGPDSTVEGSPPETAELPVAPEALEPPVLAYEQGINEYGFQGTCGPTTVSNSLNRLLGGSEYNENSCLISAVDAGLCSVDGDPAECGGTTTDQLVDLYGEIEPDRIDVQALDFENALSADEIAQQLDAGNAINVSVDSKTLWGEDYGFDAFSDQVVSDHWVEVSGVRRDEAGAIAGFDIVDSGGGVDYVDADKFHAMYMGTPDRAIADPTCLVISRKA